ncbi:MAG: hypothetical protein PHP10_00910 [Candidatus Omnitrophica bacterium]|nr:hypothetical protein [Candidatus Omnitrophota bacterium]
MLSKPRGLTFRLISASLIFFFAVSFTFPKESLAYRSRDGGGEIAEFDFGKWALGTAAGVVSSTLGSAIISGVGGSLGWTPGGSFMESLSSLKGADTWASNFVNSTAVGQVQNAIGMMGNYYGWDPGSTIFLSSVAGGVVGGGLAPGHFGSSLGSGVGVSQSFNGSLNWLKGVGIGLVEGSVEGAILMSAADKKGRIDPIIGNVANLTGSLVTGGLVGGLTGPTGEFSFGNMGDFNLAKAGQEAMRVTLRSIPSAGLSMGVQSITRSMDKQDAYIIKNAFSGAYYMINVPTGYLVDSKIVPSVFGERSRVRIKNTELPSPLLKETLNPSSKIPSVSNYSQSNPPGFSLEKRIEDISTR